MERLKNKTDGVNSMILPELKASSESFAKSSEIIDKNKLKKISPQQKFKKVRVTDNNTPLKRGPGDKYLKVGNASKGDEFELVRVERGFDKGRTWYLVRDSLGNKFFIAKDLTVEAKKTSKKRSPY